MPNGTRIFTSGKILGKYNERCAKIESLLTKYRGDEHGLYLKMCDKYKVKERLPRFPPEIGSENMSVLYCSVLEFTAPEPTVYLPHWFMQNLGLQEGTLVRLQRADIKKAVFLQLQPQENGFNNMLKRHGSKELLEACLIKYSVLTVGQIFVVEWKGRTWSIRVLDAKPEKTVALVNSDPKVDLTPLPFNENDEKELARVANEPEMQRDIYNTRVQSFSKFNVHEQEQMALALKRSLDERSKNVIDDEKNLIEIEEPKGNGTQCQFAGTQCQFCGKFIEINFELHELHCRRRGPKHKCKWCGVYKTLQHEIDCGNEEEKCSTCGATVLKRLLSKHVCKVPCDLCGRRLVPAELDLHKVTDCPKRQTACKYCNLPFLYSELESHMAYCGSKSGKCELCFKSVAKSKMEEHLKTSCPVVFPKLVSDVKETSIKPQRSLPLLPPIPQSSMPLPFPQAMDIFNLIEEKTAEIDLASRFISPTQTVLRTPNDPFFCPHCHQEFYIFDALETHLKSGHCIIMKARSLQKVPGLRLGRNIPKKTRSTRKVSGVKPRNGESIGEKFDNKWLCQCGWLNGRAKLRCPRCSQRRPSV